MGFLRRELTSLLTGRFCLARVGFADAAFRVTAYAALPHLPDRRIIRVSDAFVGDKPDARPGVGRQKPDARSVAPEGGVP